MPLVKESIKTKVYLIGKKNEKEKPLKIGELIIKTKNWICLSKSINVFWLITNHTFEVYLNKMDDYPKYYICNEWSWVSLEENKNDK